ncbi:MAG: universal stress protein [Chloroflexi bacterium]|nr:universal stress protein [Chloroflexota bacterium]
MFKTILIPLDGSTRAEKILPLVEELARVTQSRLLLLQIVVPVYYVMDPQVSYVDINLEQTKFLEEEAREYLEGVCAKLSATGLSAEALVRQGPVVETIIDVAQETSADVIAMASHGRTGLARVFYGGVAAGVLQKVDRPLLLIRSRDDD